MIFGRDRVEYKTRDQVIQMRAAGLIVAQALQDVKAAAHAGVSTADLDLVAARVISEAGAKPSFLGYDGFPATICTSVNDQVIHGIPSGRVLEVGDLLSIDCGAIVNGWHADAAISLVVEGQAPASQAAPAAAGIVANGPSLSRTNALCDITQDALWAAIAQLVPGARISVVGEAVETTLEEVASDTGEIYGIVEDFVGHGIGSEMHQDPDIVNYRTRERGLKIKPGMCLAIEPMITLGDREVTLCEDDWTVVTADGSYAAHWEHSVAILDDGIIVLTEPDGGAAQLARFGVTPVEL